MSAFRKLISPLEFELFFEDYWTKKSVLISNNDREKFAALFSWEKLNYLLNFHELGSDILRLSKDEKVLDRKKNNNFMQHCREGATLIIDRVHKLIPEIAEFVSELRYETDWRFQVNMYCSGGGKQGFACHYDTHEVFAMQIEGQKEWYIFQDTYKYPLRGQKSKLYSPPDQEPSLVCTLNPGDVLYIPRGHWHYAIAHDQPSLHLTLGVHCKTGIDLLEWLVGELSKKEEWRKSMPMLTDTNSARSYIDNLIQKLDDYIDNTEICNNYIYNATNLDKYFGNFSFPYQLGFNIFPNGKETIFYRPKFQKVNILKLPDDSGYTIKVANKEILLNGVTESLINNLFSKHLFTGNDVITWLSDFDWEIDIVPLLSRLVIEEVIFVKS
ncbi:cupin domain-containing protein [Microcystis aeruginosa]|uniref:Cupin 4 n=1 Tax=Microcystis aeruginosa NIES-3787 TaxID=2517782 RepID=A0A6H9G8Q1_MICAE|nr:cupin domain-containing protein [Microcystis aeruginosa]GCL47037.1 cupin 4 [Microcystis aeruginosa NIES-3787]